MRKTNAKGRNKFESHIRLHRGILNSGAWKSLSCQATRLLIQIWARHNGGNNGKIPYSKREALTELHIGSQKAQKAFQELQDKGFLICRSKGSFDYKVSAGEGRASEWEITEEPCDGHLAKKTYKKWTKKQKPGTTVVPAGDHGSTRFTHFAPPSGDHGSTTYNIPGRGAEGPSGQPAVSPRSEGGHQALVNRLGADGWSILTSLPDEVVADLAKRQSDGALTNKYLQEKIGELATSQPTAAA